jgi:hypothetical protein
MADETESPGSQDKPRPAPGQHRKTADPPHHLTLLTAVSALAISIGGLVVSFISYQSSSRTAYANLKLAEEVQSAFLESDIKLDSRLADLDRLNSNSGKPVKIVLSWTLRNAGNTAATRVTSKWVASLNDSHNSSIRPIGEPNRFGYKMDKHTKQDLPIVLELTQKEFRQFRNGKAQIEVTGQLQYKDIFNNDHTLSWTALLKGDDTPVIVRQY